MAKEPTKTVERNQQYWKSRAERNILDGEKTVLAYEKQLKRQYDKALADIEKEINAFYHKYAKENKVSLAEARKRLNPKELKSFKEQQQLYLDEVERIGTANVKQYVNYLKQFSARAHITKLDELQANIRYHVEKLTIGYHNKFTELMSDNYEDAYYKTTFDVQQRVGIGTDFTQPNGKLLGNAIAEKWNGQNYSDRIWANKDSLLQHMDTIIPQGFVRGKNSSQLADDMSKRLGVSYNNARRLLRTEINYISNKGTINAYKESGVVKQYEYLATLDGRTSDICIEMDGKIINIQEARVGVTIPPLHPNCRSTTVPYFEDDEFTTTVDRIARNSQGKSYFVGKDVTYKEWATEHTSAEYVKRKYKGYPKKR